MSLVEGLVLGVIRPGVPFPPETHLLSFKHLLSNCNGKMISFPVWKGRSAAERVWWLRE